MNSYLLRLNRGGTNYTGIIRADSYQEARWKAGVSGYPPGYIWSIEPQ